MSIQGIIAPESYERLRTTLAKTFPDTTQITDAMVDSAVEAMWRDYRPEYAEMGVPPPPPAGPEAFGEAWVDATKSGFPIYVAHATHHRTLKKGSVTPMQSRFMGNLPVVRVTLPPKLTGARDHVISTPLGEVYLAGDHLVGSIELIASKYAGKAHLGYTPERVDLITPARLNGMRFGAIAMYLGYRHMHDPEPSFYLLEAGTAMGEAKVLYFGKTIDATIVQPSWYDPTPFSSPSNTYRGHIRVDGVDPVHLSVQAFEPGHTSPYIEVNVDYERVTALSVPWPLDLVLGATQRVALIGQTMGVPSGIPLEGLWAMAGSRLRWIQAPTMGAGSSPR
ncbi:hypothetical protein [Sorangium sp. So ce131]|uniref:hypothetical protein n=1 Tax=Sorangium sp. So ce131 TaxID=3133282 RepID=UPI003F5E5F37